jgi:hypothetical protein
MSTPACHRAPSDRGAIHARRPVMGAYRSTGGRRSLMVLERLRQVFDRRAQRPQFAPKHRYRGQRHNDAAGIANDGDGVSHTGLHRTAEQNADKSGAYAATFDENVTTQPLMNTRPSGP